MLGLNHNINGVTGESEAMKLIWKESYDKHSDKPEKQLIVYCEARIVETEKRIVNSNYTGLESESKELEFTVPIKLLGKYVPSTEHKGSEMTLVRQMVVGQEVVGGNHNGNL